MNPKVGIIMGSQSDWATMKHAADILDELGEVPAAVRAASAKVAVLAPASAFAAWGDLGAVAFALPDDVAGMARELYAALRDLDAAGVDVVIAALPPAAGLGEAVGDRLRRAAGPRKP